MSQNPLNIRFAAFEDIPPILELLEKNLVENKKTQSEESLINEGFISYRFEANDLRGWLLQPDFFILVCEKNNEVIGYTIGCDFDTVPANLQASLITVIEGAGIFNARHIFYHKEIVTADGNKGIGACLMNRLFVEAQKNGFSHVVCLIGEQPHHNAKSSGFHKKMGFTPIGSIQDRTKVDGVYLKTL